MGRVRVLDETKKREICTLLTAGMSYQRIASYVGCSRKTIVNERRADEGFDQRLRQARVAHELNPLHAMRKFAATHWRAAAWMLEREERLERARREERRQQRLQPSDIEQLAQRAHDLVKHADIIQLTGQPIAEQVAQLIRDAAGQQESACRADVDDWELDDWGDGEWDASELDNEELDEGEVDCDEPDSEEPASNNLEPEETVEPEETEPEREPLEVADEAPEEPAEACDASSPAVEEAENSFPRGNLSTEDSPSCATENRVNPEENVASELCEIDSHSIELAEVGNNRPDSHSPVGVVSGLAVVPDQRLALPQGVQGE
ncbi:helix-turn-helix domain-containing protein [Aeoliella mucimassa]|uniref:Transposase IS30-like HTH domain-containing protein n=1 Tax=Aeoliella mucimassa TaxID=2527972 RepID=A0A518AQQ2_9BACT|nr:helix-turn-helix domain-containing protein [Aeoliella mucimassa]QDU57060.1 hypothetical protein Pan181_32740 [Aeoliella mucimassa]